MNNIIQCSSASDAWIKTSKYILSNGVKYGDITECLNLIIEIKEFKKDDNFDKNFRNIFGDERIDYASRVTFVEPQEGVFADWIYSPIKPIWKDTYFGRMVLFQNKFNQIENVLKILSQHIHTKRCEIVIYDPMIDAKNMYKQPCLLAIDIKPRDDELFLNAIFRSQAVSKSGYADYTALIKLGQFLANTTKYTLNTVSLFIASAHIRKQKKEYINTMKLLKLYENDIN